MTLRADKCPDFSCEVRSKLSDKEKECNTLTKELEYMRNSNKSLIETIKTNKVDNFDDSLLNKTIILDSELRSSRLELDKSNFKLREVEKKNKSFELENENLRIQNYQFETEDIINEKIQNLKKERIDIQKSFNYSKQEYEKLKAINDKFKKTKEKDVEEINELRNEHNNLLKKHIILEKQVKKRDKYLKKTKRRFTPLRGIKRTFLLFKDMIRSKFKRDE